MAISLTAGQSLQAARNWAEEIARDYVDDRVVARQELAECDRLMTLALKTGVPLAGLLHGLAHQERRAAHAEAVMRVETLAVKLMIPLGVCVLPAFIAVGVLPVVASVISSTALNS
jgi:tight adherence protein B